MDGRPRLSSSTIYAARGQATAAQAADLDAALTRLVGAGGEAMGELFKAVAFADPRLGALPGFDS